MKKVLLIDDSSLMRTQLENILVSGGFEVLTATDGIDGLKVARENCEEIGVIISDVNMPKMDGLEMLRTLKKEDALRQIPVFVLTTEGSGKLVKEARKAGAKGWLVKPFKAQDIIALVAQLIRSKP